MKEKPGKAAARAPDGSKCVSIFFIPTDMCLIQTCRHFFSLLRQRKGEFVPDKTYPSPPNNKHNGDAVVEDLENIDTFIDPSTQITDVPHKPTRGSAGGSSAGGPKKQRKPMGVKVTYKPPEWD